MLQEFFNKIKTKYEDYPESWVYSSVPLFFLGMALYWQMAWVPGFFADGLLYAAFGKNAAEAGHWLVPHLNEYTYSQFSQHTPFVFILEGLFFKVFGASYTSARIFSGLFPLASAGLLIWFLRRNDQKSWSYFAGLVLILIPPLLKKSRFPNMDLPLMLFFLASIISYWFAWKEKKSRYWYLSGFFFGSSLLSKGPMALPIPLIILLHLGVTKTLSKLRSPHPWMGFLLGSLIFGIWPLSLWLTGKMEIFKGYIHHTFGFTLLKGRGVEKNSYFQHIIFLIKQTGPWIWLGFFGVIQFFRKERKNPLLALGVCFFLGLLFPLSLAKFKYSHYLIPLYPAMAMLAGFVLKELSFSFKKKFSFGMRILAPLTTLVLVVFPLTNKSRRDPEIFQLIKMTRLLQEKPEGWVIVDESYPYFAMVSLMNFEGEGPVFRFNEHEFLDWLRGKPVLPTWKTDKVVDYQKKRLAFLITGRMKRKMREMNFNFKDYSLQGLVSFSKKDLHIYVPVKELKSDFYFSQKN